ncbi:MAG TPA: LLM class flavin-dependent oxidoreductase [Solirubrobacterales bacterium]|nr:LLM class flavin-dependent oxidoreductase [Solirubrobacterales bacterium]
MDVAIGLPNAVPGTTGGQLVEWARRADVRGFSSLGTIDRIVYENYEPLAALAAAAAVTERIGLCTSVLLGPLHVNPVKLAKQALSVHALSAGRFTLGIGLGGRDDDYEVSGIEPTARGRRLDEMLAKVKEVWSEGEVGPTIAGAPGLIVGGHADASFARAARFGDGWIAAASGPDQFAAGLEKTRAAWSEAGRDGVPRTQALAYFSLGDRAEDEARAYLTDYYAWLGEEIAEFLVAGAARDPETVKQEVATYEAAGCDELILCPCSGDPEQVDLLAGAVGL